MIDENEKNKFRKEKMAEYEKAAIEYQKELKEKYKYISRKQDNRLEKEKEIKIKLSINLEKIIRYKNLIKKLTQENCQYACEIKKIQNSFKIC